MRNGNCIFVQFCPTHFNSSYRTYEEWKRVLWQVLTKRWWYAFLPYLWGMETRSGNCSHLRLAYRSYRTYEEWKRSPPILLSRNGLRSYRTYEEWKPKFFSAKGGDKQCSYRTYEEWKPVYAVCTSQWRWWVLTVPMRNGNGSPCKESPPLRTYVLTVPMRNGNFEYLTILPEYCRVLTVPMRNGNEACKS